MSSDKQYYVYILANKPYGTLYTGVTNGLLIRTCQHKNNLMDGFSARYNTHRLVYYVIVGDIESAIAREKQIKKWKRHWKLRLINEFNPQWRDLYYDLVDNGNRKWIPASAGMTKEKSNGSFKFS